MCPSHYTLTTNEVCRYAAGLLQPHLHWQDQGPKYLVATLLKILYYAAGQLCSLFAACDRLREAPSDQAVRDALTALCPQAQPLERRLNASFAAQLPKAVKGRRWRLAINLNLRPYYGQAHHRVEEIAQCGTTHFHAYATCYLVHRGRRGRHGRQRLIYALWGFQPNSTQWIVQVYRQRFGSETSYRQLSDLHQNHHPQPRTALAVCRDGVIFSQCVGPAPLALFGHPTPRRA
jgi:putative transposase